MCYHTLNLVMQLKTCNDDNKDMWEYVVYTYIQHTLPTILFPTPNRHMLQLSAVFMHRDTLKGDPRGPQGESTHESKGPKKAGQRERRKQEPARPRAKNNKAENSPRRLFTQERVKNSLEGHEVGSQGGGVERRVWSGTY